MVHSRSIVVSVATILGIAATACASRAVGDEPVELRLQPYAGPLRTLTGTLAGKESRFLFDTGGGATVLSLPAATAAGVVRFGRGTGFRHDGQRIDGSRGTPVA